MNELRLSQRIQRIKPSATLALNARAARLRDEGKDVIALTAGEPDFDAPPSIVEVAQRALTEGGRVHHYTPAPGLPDVRAAVARKFERDNGLHYASTQCVLSCGAKHSVFNALAALVDDGDEVIVPAPYWVSYPEMVAFLGGKSVIIDTLTNGFVPTADQVKAALTDRTRAIVLNTPGNPTGAVWPRQALTEIAKVLEGTDVVVISDEIYEKLVYEGEHVSFGTLSDDAFSRTVTINGVAKAYSMTGWRIGYAAGPDPIIRAMIALQSHSTSNPTTVAQMAAKQALLQDPPELNDWVERFKVRRAILVDGLNALEGIDCPTPGGAFYAFADVRGLIGKSHQGTLLSDDAALCEALLVNKHVAGVPGSAFGAKGFIRFSYATSENALESAVARIAAFVSELS